MGFSSLSKVIVSARADRFAQAFEPDPRPRELDTEYRKANRNNDKGGARRHYHDNTE